MPSITDNENYGDAPLLSPAQVAVLLDTLCIEMGFCLEPESYQRLQQSPPEDVESFTRAVFVAEGLEPETEDRRLYRQVRKWVDEAFKAAVP